MLKFAALSFICAMLPGNIFAPVNVVFGVICLLAAIVDRTIK